MSASGQATLDWSCPFSGTEDRGRFLRRLANVPMVQAADFRKLYDLARRRKLDGPEVGGILGEREMCPRLMVVGEGASEDAVEVSLVENEHVIQALAPD